VPAVDGGAPAAGLPAAPELPGGRGRNDLPPDVPVLVGREAELEVLLGAGDPGGCAFVAVDGMGGVGKTALAVHAAHRLADRYPDAALFVSLHGHSSSRRPVTALHALGVLLRALGVDGSHLPARLDERAALWRATAAGRRMLVLLDDAIDARQVRPLIASSRGCLTIVTSRRRLSSVDWTRCLSLDVLGADRAGALFAERAGELRATQEQSAVREVVRLCGGLPLALCAAGARVRHRPTWTVRDLAERLGDEQRRLSELSVGERSIAGSLRLSYDHLSAAQQRALRLLAILPGDEFGAPACAAAAGIEVAEAEADLEELVDVHLVQSGRPGRYRLHDLVRQFARALSPAGSDPAGEPVGRLLDFHLAMAVATVDLLDAQRRRFEPVLRHRIGPRDALPATAQEAAAWLDLERANLVEAVRWAYEHGKLRLCWQLACALWPYFHFGKYTDDWFATHRYALRAAAELADPRAEAMIHEQLGVAYWMANRDAEAARHNRLALTLHRRAEDDRGQGAVLGMLGRIAARAGDDAEALRQFEASLALLRRVGDDVEEAHVLNSMAILRYRMGDADASSATFGAALLLFRAVGDERSEARVLANIGYLHLTAHRYAEALELLQRALRLRERLIDRRPSELLKNLAMALRGLGRLEEALRHQQEALAATLRLDDPRELAGALNDLAETLCSLERPDEARARYREALAAARRCDDEAQQARARDGLAALSRRSPETTRAAAPARRPPAASA
jgi:tetratricopeptide (TPR) repeat protein